MTMEEKIDWNKVECPKCKGKKFFGKYTDKPYCYDCGTFFDLNKKLVLEDEIIDPLRDASLIPVLTSNVLAGELAKDMLKDLKKRRF